MDDVWRCAVLAFVGGGEVRLPAYETLSAEDLLQERAVEQMLVGVATRKYDRSLEALPASVKTRGTSKSAVSRRFVARTRAELDAWTKRPLGDLDIVALMVDGIGFGDHGRRPMCLRRVFLETIHRTPQQNRLTLNLG